MTRSKRTRTSPPAIAFRQIQLKLLTTHVGVYALCDLDHVPIYVGQSVDGIRQRVRRHLTSARSDVIANRQVDVWEIASVRAWALPKAEIGRFEALIFHACNDHSPLMNGSVPLRPVETAIPLPTETIPMIPDDEVLRRRAPDVRLTRQIEHYLRLVDHFLNVKDSKELQLSMDVHFARLSRYHRDFLALRSAPSSGSQDASDLSNDD